MILAIGVSHCIHVHVTVVFKVILVIKLMLNRHSDFLPCFILCTLANTGSVSVLQYMECKEKKLKE